MEEQVTFATGGIPLEGRLYLPRQQARVGVVVCHPHPLYGGDMHNNVVEALVDAFGRAGMATLRFNFRGVGGSGGTHDEGRGEQDDVEAAVGSLLGRVNPGVVAVAGYSFGSIVGLAAGARDQRVHKLVGVALPVARRDASFLAGVTKPKLLVSGDRDDISPVPKLQELHAASAEPKSLVLIEGADHFFRGLEHRVADAAARFLAD